MIKKLVMLFIFALCLIGCKEHIPASSIVCDKYMVAEKTHTTCVMSGNMMYPMTSTTPEKHVLVLDSAGYIIHLNVSIAFFNKVECGDSLFYEEQEFTIIRHNHGN